MSDFEFKNARSVGPEALHAAMKEHKAFVIYVYSPTCPYCIQSYAKYDAVADASFIAFNNKKYPGLFEKATGVAITAVPTLLGVSKSGRIIEYTGQYEGLRTFKAALEKT
jgi:hypothetical protein